MFPSQQEVNALNPQQQAEADALSTFVGSEMQAQGGPGQQLFAVKIGSQPGATDPKVIAAVIEAILAAGWDQAAVRTIPGAGDVLLVFGVGD